MGVVSLKTSLRDGGGDETVAAMAGALILANNCATPAPFVTLRYENTRLTRRPSPTSQKPRGRKGVRAAKRDGDDKKISFGDRLLDYIEGTRLGASELT